MARAARAAPAGSQEASHDSYEVRDFVDRFMPAYKTYLKGLYADPKDSTSPLGTIPRLIFSITSAREPLAKPVEFNFTSEALQD